MNISDAARASGISAKMIRHYEAIRLLPAAPRRRSGYRDYDDADVHRLRFIKRARDLGFSLDRIRSLLKLWSDTGRSNAEVKAIAAQHLRALEAQLESLRQVVSSLRSLVDACDGSGRPHCPIIAGLDHGTGLTSSTAGSKSGSRPPAPPATSRRRLRVPV